MEKFTTLTAVACPLPMENVDTDQLIPARFMSRSRAQGYGQFLLHDLRFDRDGQPRDGFVLDAPRYAASRILVARRNFGTGSSREAAVYALVDFGIRCVIAPSFGDIFASNAVKNGLLPAVVSDDAATAIERYLQGIDPPEATVDLTRQAITCGDCEFAVSIDPVRRQQLLNGWDDIDVTDQYAEAIGVFRRARAISDPWAFPEKITGAQ